MKPVNVHCKQTKTLQETRSETWYVKHLYEMFEEEKLAELCMTEITTDHSSNTAEELI